MGRPGFVTDEKVNIKIMRLLYGYLALSVQRGCSVLSSVGITFKGMV